MNSSGVSAAISQQPMVLPIAVVPPSQTVPGGNLKSCESDRKIEQEPEFFESFSKGILRRRLNEYWSGKYTQKYIEVYLEFIHLSGMIDNLEYLEFKNALDKGQL